MCPPIQHHQLVSVIKYLGSKRRLVPTLTELFVRSGAHTALDLFTGTTRVAQAFKRAGGEVTAVDTARYAKVFGDTFIALDGSRIGRELDDEIDRLNSLPGIDGYVTETFCRQSRFFQLHNGQRIDAIREAIERDHPTGPLRPVLLTSLLLAADKVDSTTGIQMAYVKKWAPRSYRDLTLRRPDLIAGSGHAQCSDAIDYVTSTQTSFDLAYLDPPYNQHRYVANYHVWETLVANDQPEHYGVACKRVDIRDEATHSVFNRKREMPAALGRAIDAVRAEVVIVSYNDESWISLDELVTMCSPHGHVAVLGFDSARYVGARIGIHSPTGERVGTVGRTRNLEYVIVAGDRDRVEHMVKPYSDQRIAATITS